MKPPLRLVHASDIHLDTDYYGGPENLALRDYNRGVFERLLRRIEAEQPQLMLLPGDLFDSNRASAETIVWAMEQLGRLPCPVLMIPGNHDCLEPDAIYRRHDFGAIPNVEMLLAAEGEHRELPVLQARAWGKGMVEHSTEFRPLDGLPAAEPERWNLALGHGIYVGRDGFSFRSSPVEARQIARSGYDYIALGHHHALLDVSANGTAAFYSGAPVPISPDRAGTYLVVELCEGKPASVQVRQLD
jgi:DNA repair exonuclease SbcCD nuclease subunit